MKGRIMVWPHSLYYFSLFSKYMVSLVVIGSPPSSAFISSRATNAFWETKGSSFLIIVARVSLML